MRTRLVSLAFVMALAMPAALRPAAETRTAIAWTNGKWFDGTAFRSVDVYSVGDRLTLKRPRSVDRTVDLAGRYVTGAFGEAHNHNIPGGDTDENIRTYLKQGIFYVMIQANVPEAPAELAAQGQCARNGRRRVRQRNLHRPRRASHGARPAEHQERRNERRRPARRLPPSGGQQGATSTAEWDTRIRQQHPDFIKLTLAYSEDRVAGIPRPATATVTASTPRWPRTS